MAHQSDWQFLRLEYRIADQVGGRHLGGRDQVEVLVALDAEQILLELGQLAGSRKALAVSKIRKVGFRIAVLPW